MFLFRLSYGYFVDERTQSAGYSDDFFASVENLGKNYASEKKVMLEGNSDHEPARPALSAAANAGQKYEKTATIKSKSTNFERDEKAIRNTTSKFNAVVQYEQNSGNKGNRVLHLLIGVNPDSFDHVCLSIKKIGIVKATEVTKIDKTNDYRKLNAKKASLETTLASLNELKSKTGQIADFVALHDKILEIEGQLQELGVELGDFASENEFCTVRLSVYEGATEKQTSMYQRIRIALEWTIQYFALFVVCFAGVCCAVFLLLVIIDKLSIFKAIEKKVSE